MERNTPILDAALGKWLSALDAESLRGLVAHLISEGMLHERVISRACIQTEQSRRKRKSHAAFQAYVRALQQCDANPSLSSSKELDRAVKREREAFDHEMQGYNLPTMFPFRRAP